MPEQRDIVVRYGEIGLKGKNRPDFEKQLITNLKEALAGLPYERVERPRGRILVRNMENPRPGLAAVANVPGVQSASVAMRASHDKASIEQVGGHLMDEGLALFPGTEPVTFKVETSRSFKRYPLTSMELSAWLGGTLIQRFPRLKARMKNPTLRLVVEVRPGEVLLSSLHQKGPGGLPVGSSGSVVTLLSGGIDSPVAAYLAMKRGARVVFINFHSYPFIPEVSLDKVKALVGTLSPYQKRSLLLVIPFSNIQVAIKKQCPEEMRTVLYRRMMMRLAERAANETGALALVTGESLGQVASQTLENMSAIGAATRLPVLRPLVGFDKEETVNLAEKIGTYATSILPHPDCCTVFQPRKPVTRAKMAQVEGAETPLDLEVLLDEAFSRKERFVI